jgi:hypothetical protein
MGEVGPMPSVTAHGRVTPPAGKPRCLKQTFMRWPSRRVEAPQLVSGGLMVDEYDEVASVTLTPSDVTSVPPAGLSR